MKTQVTVRTEQSRQAGAAQRMAQLKGAQDGFVDARSDAVAQRRMQEMASNSPRAKQLKAQAEMMDGSPRMAVQRMERAAAFGGAVQLAAKEEEPKQGKFETAQRAKEEELQAKFATPGAVQRQSASAAPV